jgi:TonB-linked SusC/RagA family outer membrane protein
MKINNSAAFTKIRLSWLMSSLIARIFYPSFKFFSFFKKVFILTNFYELFNTSIVDAQTRRVTGRVLGADGNPVAGASITVNGTTTGTQTDAAGNFSLSVPGGKNTVTISSVGFETQNVTIPGSNNISTTLRPTTTALNEIVVTGYTAQRKKDITGSVAVVNVKDLKAVPAGSPEQMLQGRASGLNITTSGQPGSGSSIRIRGITSFGNADPLVVIDGVQASLSNIDANDIESIQVLKDAGAASIYGVRGANGVIVVTTKKGKPGKVTLTYDAYYGIQLPVKNKFNLLNPQEMADLTWIAYKNSGTDIDTLTGNPTHPQYGNGATPVLPDYILPSGAKEGDPAVDPSKYNIDFSRPVYQIVKANKQGTDWFHEIFKPAPIQSHTLSASGGSDKSTYLFSLNYFNQQGTLIQTYLKRYSVRLNTVFNLNNKVRIGENAYMFYRDNPQIGNQSEGNEISQIYRIQPIVPVYDIKGNWGGGAGSRLGQGYNPVASRIRAKDNRGNQWDVQGNVFGEVDFLRHFTARTAFGGTQNNGYYYYFGYRTYENAENVGQNSYTERAYYNRNWTWTNSITYTNVFAQVHNVKVFAATEAIDYYGRNLGGDRNNLFSNDPNFRNLSNGSPTGQNNYSGAYQNSIFSLIGRLDYNYNDKYLLSATVRRDGSSVFGPEKRYGIFPAVTLGWRLSNEAFMKSISWLSDLKLRGGYGILGSAANVSATNQFTLYGGGPRDAYYDISGANTSSIIGFRQTSIGNPATGWEEDKILNIGLDATVLNKFDFSVEWYKKSIKGLLFNQPLPATAGGAGRPTINIGNVENTGVDFNATYRGNISKDFRYDVGVVFTRYKSNITSIPGGYFGAGGSRIGDFARNQEGHPIGAFFGYEVIGLFQSDEDVSKSPTQDGAAPGRFKYRDIDGLDENGKLTGKPDGKISDVDRTFFGNPNPDFTYGFNLGASYKGFDFSMFLYGSQGNEVINYVRWWTDFFPSFQGVKSKNALYNSWTPQRPNATTPIAENVSNFSNNATPNSYYMEDGSYLRCKSVILGYAIPVSNLRRFGISRLRIYLQAANLFTITKYSGLDPELMGPTDDQTERASNRAFGIDYGNYPNSQKNFNFGVNVTF